MRILIACEFSGIVRDAFIARGHDAWSCDLLPTESRIAMRHYQGDVLDYIGAAWDLMIAFPPCTHLAVSGARWFKGKAWEQYKAILFAEALWNAPIPRIAIENPIGILSTKSRLGKSTQIIQPWHHGHGETKATCLWLRGLPKLIPSNIVEGREPRIHHMPPSPDRGKLRSITLAGIAEAMARNAGGENE